MGLCFCWNGKFVKKYWSRPRLSGSLFSHYHSRSIILHKIKINLRWNYGEVSSCCCRNRACSTAKIGVSKTSLWLYFVEIICHQEPFGEQETVLCQLRLPRWNWHSHHSKISDLISETSCDMLLYLWTALANYSGRVSRWPDFDQLDFSTVCSVSYHVIHTCWCIIVGSHWI